MTYVMLNSREKVHAVPSLYSVLVEYYMKIKGADNQGKG
jgi:hypothetical protein